MSVYKELKRRDAVRKIQGKSKKQKSRVEFAISDIRSKSANASVSSSARQNRSNSVISTVEKLKFWISYHMFSREFHRYF